LVARRKARDHRSVDPIRLGALAQRARKEAYLRRIDHHNRQARRSQARRHHRFEPARRLHGNKLRRDGFERLDQKLDATGITAVTRGRSGRMHRHVQPIFRDINSNNDGVHLIPSLRNRASRAAQATVRVQWNDGRGAALRFGLQSPRMSRPPTRHRTN